MADNVFSLEVLRARQGDCLMLHYGSHESPALALIDGGPGGVYKPFLRPRLEALRAERGLSADEALPVDLCMLSHIDNDHAVGLIGLTEELVEAVENKKPKIVRIVDLWHNTFDDLIDNDTAELAGAVEERFGPAAMSGDGLPPGLLGELQEAADPQTAVDSVMVLAGIKEGRQLRDDATRLGIERNLEFDGELIVASSDGEPKELGSGLRLTVVGPMLPDVKALQKKHADWVAKHPEEVRKSAAGLAAYVDDSVPNLSSIVVLVEVAEPERRTILLTGDARGDKILKGMEFVGLLEPGGSIHVDVLKCPHHGSARNVEQGFFERITADHYVFSGDGQYGNPERETFEMLAAARGEEDYMIHLTYPVDRIDVERKKDWEKNRAQEHRRHPDNPAKVRPAWSNAEHSLAAFLTDHPDIDDRLVVVEEGAPHIIDLLGRP